MSKGLEDLKWLVESGYIKRHGWQEDVVMLDCINNIEKELKALEILKAFDFEIEDYTEELNGSVSVKLKRIILDNDEIDLLKEVLL